MSTQRKLRAAPPLDSTAVATQQTFLDIPGCEFTETGLRIKTKISFDHWERLGEVLKRAETGIQWWLGDWMIYGEHQYGEKYAQALDASEQTGINADTLRNYHWVSERIPSVMRITELPWSFHQVVAGLPEVERNAWLSTALNRKLTGDPYTFRELKRDVEKAERQKNFKLVNSILEKLWERMQDGCWTAEALGKCSECGNSMFGLDVEEIKLYQQQLVDMGRAEWRKQGGRKDGQKGEMVMLCVPVGTPAGSDMSSGYCPRVEWGEDEEHF